MHGLYFIVRAVMASDDYTMSRIEGCCFFALENDHIPALNFCSLCTQAPRKQLASKAARKSAPSTGGVKKPHRFR